MSDHDMLHIALQDGFDDDAVVVRVDGREVYRRRGVVTDTRISLADSFEVPKPAPPATVEVELPERHLRDSFSVELEGPIYLGVSLLEESLQFRAQAIPFGYM